MKAPFPYFGGKSRVADDVWQRFGDVKNYVEPFAGSLAVLLSRPTKPNIETVNDKDGFIANFWRSLRHDPEGVAYHADWPVNEVDLHARHHHLVNVDAEHLEQLKSDPDYYDARVAGWWVWGISQWIGSGWCDRPDWSGRGNAGAESRGIHADRVHRYPTRKRSNLSGWSGKGVHKPTLHKKRPHLMSSKGVHSQRVQVPQQKPDISGDGGAAGRGIHASAFHRRTGGIYRYFKELSDRLRRVRVCCGDWSRITGRSVTTKIGTTAVFLDPPYDKHEHLYSEANEVSAEVREWAIERGDDPKLRIALCGFSGEHDMPDSWECFAWKSPGGYGSQGGRNINADRERIWFSPHCLKPGRTLFGHTA